MKSVFILFEGAVYSFIQLVTEMQQQTRGMPCRVSIGFAVLRYDKRGVGENSTVIDANLLGDATVHKLQNDAEDALKVLLDQPEVERRYRTHRT